jgi:prepilin-type N-terminal cleavage/methylation domain-containing protein
MRYQVQARLLTDDRETVMKMNIKSTEAIREAGFTLLEIMVVISIISLLAAIAIPSFMKARANSQANSCINNLRQLDSAANQFALELHKRSGQDINYPTDLTPYVKLNTGNSIPSCPAGGNYACNTVGDAPSCDLSTSASPPHLLQ